MVDAITKTLNRPFHFAEQVGPTTLNLGRRKDELREITNSNQRMSRRLEATKSNYSASQMKQHFMQSQRYALNSSYSLRKKCEDIARDLNKRNHV